MWYGVALGSGNSDPHTIDGRKEMIGHADRVCELKVFVCVTTSTKHLRRRRYKCGLSMI